ncbi:hypothetical protein PVK06_040655 [Gossypium arboreum]|uniref:Uncharacterized protein n=1 Tax=Gossypium arboreum TaxID=29729 RepID=A0ABR0N899_GOSAR|nr:hypothetical protein PVK06_040655 [Gossypium arboreum]
MRGCGCASRPGTSAAVTCDAHIHSANHQARRYHLVLVDPFLNASNCQPDEVIVWVVVVVEQAPLARIPFLRCGCALSCDSIVHPGKNKLVSSRDERVWVCE